jgi:hypothetical protein
MSLNILPRESWLPLSVLFLVVLAWLQIVAAIGRAGGGFLNGLLESAVIATVGKLQHAQKRIVFRYGIAASNTTLDDF